MEPQPGRHHQLREDGEAGGADRLRDAMSDGNGGKDYTALVDHVDVVSIHAWKASEKLLKQSAEKKKTLRLYNTGMDRYSWGFYAWRVGAAGRWEWHFCFAEDQAKGGYPGREWHNPFTPSHGLARTRRPSTPAAMLFASSSSTWRRA